MSTPLKIFLTGATGYIGGDILYQLNEQYPDFTYALLIRSEDKAKTVRSRYPKARIVSGGNDDAAALEREAAWADVVIREFSVLVTIRGYVNANVKDTADSSDHAGAAEALAKGLVQGHSASRPGFWLHTGGAGILTYFDSEVNKMFGEEDNKVFNDLDGIDERVDEIVLNTGIDHGDVVKTAIVAPPTIYGQGRGPASNRGRQVYELVSFILKEGYCPRIGKGLSRWNNVHVHDLSRLFERLVQAATDPSLQANPEVWAGRGYYFAENGEHVWGEVSTAVGQEAFKQGLVKGGPPELRDLSINEAVNSSAGFEAGSWGMNSRGVAERARKVLGWKPQERGLYDELPDIVRSEAARMNL
ncbi:NAD(P)-binding protein [Aspergillus mulundensis]|uniref:NAD(P)-binding protein n=1 Tax=Aspergillus mulundensis TaxID=1810919 RepID=A0A3D8SCH9_9EURO|nr:NAD(P)-binding protein [Aspergillus mulundensis]RDW84035.1 NAD(P)-binding protein [Aspergillus mulundensis]